MDTSNNGYSFVSGRTAKAKVLGTMVTRRVKAATSNIRTASALLAAVPDETPVSSPQVQKSPEVLDREARFVTAVCAYMRRLGAKVPGPECWWAPFVVDTRAGKLYVLVYGNRILCTFENVKRAADFVGWDRLQKNGRWDFVFEDGPGRREIDAFKLEISLVRQSTMPGVAIPQV